MLSPTSCTCLSCASISFSNNVISTLCSWLIVFEPMSSLLTSLFREFNYSMWLWIAFLSSADYLARSVTLPLKVTSAWLFTDSNALTFAYSSCTNCFFESSCCFLRASASSYLFFSSSSSCCLRFAASFSCSSFLRFSSSACFCFCSSTDVYCVMVGAAWVLIWSFWFTSVVVDAFLSEGVESVAFFSSS